MNELSIEEKLIELIKELSEDQQKNLLDLIKSRQSGYREHPRKEVSVATDYIIKDKTYKDFIKNISAGGVYITTKKSQSVGDEISMNFMLTGHKRPIRVFGTIIRSTPNGFAVKFYEKVEELLNSVNENK